jgi:Protein of unknown function (DUF3800)
VNITAYFDESGTHKGSELAIMAGFIGDARQWRKFGKRASRLFARFGVDIFHSVDVKRSEKDFAGWKINKKIELLDEFQHIVNETLERGFACMLRYDDYEYYKRLEWPRGARSDSLYGILFRASLASSIDSVLRVERWALGKEPKLNIVLESGHRNANDAVRLYNLFNDKFTETPKPLAGLAFEDKANSWPLNAADLFAYSAYGEETGAKPIGTPAKPLKAEKSYRGNAYRIVVGRETLDELHAQAIELAKEHALTRRKARS